MCNTCSSFVFKILAIISSSRTDLSNYVKYWTFNKVKVIYYGFNHGLWKLIKFTFFPHPYPLSSFLQTVNHQWSASYNKAVIYVLVFPNMQTGYIYSSIVFYKRMTGLLRFRHDLLYLSKHKKTYSKKKKKNNFKFIILYQLYSRFTSRQFTTITTVAIVTFHTCDNESENQGSLWLDSINNA